MSNTDFITSFLNKKYTLQYNNNLLNQGINFNSIMAPNLQQENIISDINDIFNKIKAESSSNVPSTSFKSVTLLLFYIRRNRQNLDEIIKKISFFFNSNSDINNKILIYAINMILNLLTENNHIINFINMILPILVNYLTFSNK